MSIRRSVGPLAAMTLLTLIGSCRSRGADSAPVVSEVDSQIARADTGDSLTALLQQLHNARGEFMRGSNGTWVFSGNQTLLGSFYPFGDRAIAKLVDCLDDSDLTRVTLQSKPVPVGVLCGLALQRMASATEHEDDAGDWPGVILPTATPDELRAAKAAWKVVLESGRYRIM
jgi:hypothetical protein